MRADDGGLHFIEEIALAFGMVFIPQGVEHLFTVAAAAIVPGGARSSRFPPSEKGVLPRLPRSNRLV